MAAILITYATRQDILALITGVGGPLAGADVDVGLIAGPFAPNTRTVVADCAAVEPDNTEFPGYARITGLTWSAQYRDGNDNVYQDAGELIWIATGNPPVPLNITGAFWTNGTDLVIEMFDTPQVVAATDDPVRYVPQFGYGQ